MNAGIFQLYKQARHFHVHDKFAVLRYCIFLLTFSIYLPSSLAEPVSQIMKNDLVALADYRAGDNDKPALLILHGFMQTHNFSIIQSMTDELADIGYTVLAPTLTLGINKRSQSMTCDLIQSHQFNDHHAELDLWINWLSHKGHKEIILIGHSSGGLRILSYSGHQHKWPVEVLGLIPVNPTMPHSANNKTEISNYITKAQALLGSGNNKLNKFTLAYCIDNYTSSASAFLSYASITENKFYTYMKQAPQPVVMIMGSEDKLSPVNWNNKLEKNGANIIHIKGANHFFSNGHEFDLYDAVDTAIQHLNNLSN